MPTVDENAAIWDGWIDWGEGGEQWSTSWGGSEAQWHGTILPRIRRWLPARTILEIAPGYGRWTNYLRFYCDRLVVVDLSEKCIRACQERFAGDDRIEYHVNDGTSLDMVADGSVDFAFSFDSLVHAEADVLDAYVGELARVLAPGGGGFLHHSNAGEYRRYFELTNRIPGRALSAGRKLRVLDADEWRALSMTAARFRSACGASGLRCISQELVNWGGSSKRLIDCLSTFGAPAASEVSKTAVLENPGFMAEADAVKRWAPLYASRLGSE